MNYKKTFISLLVIVAFTISSEYCAAREESKMVEGKNKDTVVHAECINTSAGLAVGFRVEIVNLSTDKNLVLVVRDNISYLFDVRLINKEGLDISPMLPDISKDKLGPNTPATYRYDIILPGTNRSWFIPVPSQVRIDSRKPANNKNLIPTPNGEYTAEIKVAIEYFMQHKGRESIPKYPEFQYLQLTLPCIPIVVDSKLLSQIEDIYRKKFIGEASQQTTNQTAAVIPQFPGAGKTNDLGTAGKDRNP